MAALAHPLALFALGAMALPVLLYLLRRPRQVVRVGSLRALDAQRSPPALRWQPRWLILALRCALLAVLALLLADPRIASPALGQVRWLLRTPGTVLSAADHAAWEAARRDGWEPRALAAGFGPLENAAEADQTADLWSLLAELDARVAAGSRAMVFAPTTADHFPGARPTLSHLAVTWHPIERAPAPAAVAAPVTFAIVAPPERAVIAGRVRAALVAAGAREDQERPRWIVQLDGTAPDAAMQRRVAEGATRVIEPHGTDAPQAGPRAVVVGGERVSVSRRVAVPAGEVILRDESGEPLLTEVRQGRGREWHLAFRLDPEWTDWTLRAAFPRWWAEQLATHDAAVLALDAAQVTPPLRSDAGTEAESVLPSVARRVTTGLWWLAVALLVAERWVSWWAMRRATA